MSEELNSQPIKEKKDLHLMRKVWHMIPGVTLVVWLHLQLVPDFVTIILLGVLFLATAGFELARLKFKQVNDLAVGLSRHIIRKEELKQISGTPYYIGSCFLVCLIFNRDIASLSILYLALGDPTASFFGIKYGAGSMKFASGKSIIGTLGGISICMILTMIYGTLMNWQISSIYAISLLGSVSAGLAETFVPEDINDNLFIPIVSAITLSILFANYPVV